MEVKTLELSYVLVGARWGYERKRVWGLESFDKRRKVVLFTKIGKLRKRMRRFRREVVGGELFGREAVGVAAERSG